MLKICIIYSTIETKEVARNGYNGFPFPHEYWCEDRAPFTLHLNTHAEKETRYIQYVQLLLFQ